MTPDIMVGGSGAEGGNNIFSAFIAQLLAQGQTPQLRNGNGNGVANGGNHPENS
jgi:hypothetical protein